ncbi:MAG: hypothetical protein IT238_12450 [Bacteroidia bacterium]|nr:hypothetical protein [Bacteroidia bacterium]
MISEQAATNVALATYTDQQFMWLDSLAEANIKERLEDQNASNYPPPKLMISKINDYGLNQPSQDKTTNRQHYDE